MKFKVGISVFIVALATTAQPAIGKRHRNRVHKRDITIGDQGLTVTADTTAVHTVDTAPAAVEEYVPAASAYQVAAQPAAVVVDGIVQNNRALPLNLVQPGQALSQIMLTPQLQAQGAAINQRVADTTQIVMQAPMASSAAPVTIFQTVTANVVPSAAVAQVAATPLAAAAAAAVPVAAASQAATGVVAGAPAPIAAPATAQITTPALGQAAAVPVAAAAQAPVTGNLSESILGQSIPVAGAALAEPVGAPVYAQQQLYPIAAAAAQPLYQQQAYGNPLQPAIILNGGNQALPPQAIIPLDQSLADLLTHSLASTPASASLSSKDLQTSTLAAAAEAAATALDSAGDVDGADDSGALATAVPVGPEDDDSVLVSPRRSNKAVGRSAALHGKSRKNKAPVDDISADDAEAPINDDVAANAVQDEQADNGLPVNVPSTARKGKSTGKNPGAEARRRNTDRDPAPGNTRLASVANLKATAPSVDDTEDSNAEYNEVPAHNRAHETRAKYAQGGLRAEAQRIKSEASAEAREAVLSEVRAEASAEAALQASSELNMNANTIVRDEEASSERANTFYDTRERMDRGTTVVEHAKETDYPEAYTGGGVGRYAADGKEDTNTWDVHHAVSWASAHNGDYEGDAQTTLSYHPYEHSYEDDYNKYAHTIASYDDSGKDSTENGDWKVRYNGPHPTVYSASDESSSSLGVVDVETHTYSDNYYNTPNSADSQSEIVLHDYDAHSTPFNFVNMRADAALSRDAAGGGFASSSSADSLPHAVNELDPLSYGTQGYPLRDTLPFMATSSDSVASAHPSLMVIGIPQPMVQQSAAPSVSVASGSTVMVTKMVTPAIEVVMASNDS